jgi:hypothetical protein
VNHLLPHQHYLEIALLFIENQLTVYLPEGAKTESHPGMTAADLKNQNQVPLDLISREAT